jgi:hypothetical protein
MTMRMVPWSFLPLPIVWGAACGNTTDMSVGVGPDDDAGGPVLDGSSSVDAAAESDVRDAGVDAAMDASLEAGCEAGATTPCYSGPAGTEGVGICAAGVATCGAGGTWGACIGEVDPLPEVCGGPDSDCDGKLPPQQCPGDVGAMFHLGPPGKYNALGLNQYGIIDSFAVDATSGHVVAVGELPPDGYDYGLGPLPGSTTVNTFMLTFDSTLTPIAQTSYNGASLSPIHTDEKGNRLFGLSLLQGSTIDIGGVSVTGPLGMTALLDPTGTQSVWVRTFNATQAPPGQAYAYNTTFAGALNQRAIAWIDSMNGTGFIPDYGCGYHLDASTSHYVFVELGPGATCEWETYDPISIIPAAMAVRSDGSTVVSATYTGVQSTVLGANSLQLHQGTPEALLFVVDPNGAVTWVKELDTNLVANTLGSIDSRVTAVAAGPSNEIYIAAAGVSAPSVDLGGGPMPLQSTSHGGDDIVVARFDAQGNYVWAKRIPGDGIRTGVGWLGAGATAIFLTGSTGAGHVNFGGGPLSPAFLASLDFDGKLRWGVSQYYADVGGAVSGTSFVYVVTGADLWQFLY